MQAVSVMNRIRRYPHECSLIALILVSIAVNIPSLSRAFYPMHDTLSVYQFFTYYYSQLVLSHTLPLWLPSSAFGMPIESYILFSFGPFQYLALLVGYLFKIQNAFALFSVSLIGDTLFLGFGTYLFCRHILEEQWIPIFCVTAALVLVQYDQQIYWNYKILLPLPLSLYWAQLGIERQNPAYLLFSVTNLLVWSFGSLPYVLPFQGYLVLCYALCLVVPSLTRENFRISSLDPFVQKLKQHKTFWSSLGALVILCIAALMMSHIKSVMTDEMRLIVGGRDGDMKVPLHVYLTYGGNVGYEKLIEMLTGFPTNAFVGITFFTFVLFSFFSKPISRSQLALTITILFVIAFTVSPTRVARIAYYVLPKMNILRHIGYLITIGKLLLIILSGFGIRAYLHKK